MTVFDSGIAPGGVTVYSSQATLEAETGPIQQGQMAFVQVPPMMYTAVKAAPANGQALSATASTANGGQVTYWIPVNMTGNQPLQPATSGQGKPGVCRCVVTVLPAYTGSGTGTLTGSANGALAAQDGVTLAVGDTVFIPAGTTHVTAKDSGPMVVTALGGTSAKYVLTRPAWFPTGNYFTSGTSLQIGGEGAVFGNTQWKIDAASGVIDSVDPGFYVGRLTFQVTLASGTLALAAGQTPSTFPLTTGATAICPTGILSPTTSGITAVAAMKGGTVTGTVGYGIANASVTTTNVTAGYVGTAAFSVFALASSLTTQASDASTLNVTLTNW